MSQSSIRLFVFAPVILLLLQACSSGTDIANNVVDNPTADARLSSIDLISDQYTIQAGDSLTLTWTSTGANNCVAAGGWSGAKSAQGSETIGPFNESQTLTLSCTGDQGQVSDSVNITVTAAPQPVKPTLTFQASSDAVDYQGSTVLSWSATDAANCSASGGWSGAKNTSGSQTFDQLTQTSNFVLTCTGAGGDVMASLSVTVAAAPVVTPSPQLSLSASPTTVANNGMTTLSWNSQSTNSCTASGSWTGALATAGSRTITGLVDNSTFTIDCVGDGGAVSQSVNVLVKPTVTISASQTQVTNNGSTTLSWSSSNADNCVASGDWSGNKAIQGSQVISSITQDSVFNLSCSGAGGTANYSLNVSLITQNGTALLSWNAPTSNEDGTALNDLAGYKIYYGTAPGNYTETIDVKDPALSSYQINNLTSATWYFVMTAYNSANIESTYSTEVSKTIN